MYTLLTPYQRLLAYAPSVQPTDYLPMANPDAEAVLQSFLGKLNEAFGMETVYFNFSQT